jgi:RNA polymerase sigma-70 factor (ECF subfamily)
LPSSVHASPAFNPTRWSLVAQLRSGDAARARIALERLCATYWYPLYAYVRRSGHGPEEAKDFTQGFFAHILEKQMLAAADPERGRLRTFLLTALQNFLRAEWRKTQRLKRGGGMALVSIDELTAEDRYAREPADTLTPEAIYHRRWALTLLEDAMNAVRAEYVTQNKGEVFEVLKPALAGDDHGSFAELGAALGLSEGAARVAAFRLRKRYREHLLEAVASSLDATSEAEVNEEIDALFKALG